MIDLFDIELLSKDRLEKIMPSEDMNINQLRSKVALFFHSTSKLKPSPLDTKDSEAFITYLGLSDEDLIKELKSTLSYEAARHFKPKHFERLMLIYNIFVFNNVLGYQSYKYPYKYDESYIHHLSILSDDDIFIYVGVLSSGGVFSISELIKEKATRQYDQFERIKDWKKIRYAAYQEDYIQYAVMARMSLQRGDIEFYERLVKSITYSGIYKYMQVYAPSQFLYDNIGKAVPFEQEEIANDVIRLLLASVTGLSPYYNISQDEFNTSIGFLMQKYEFVTGEYLLRKAKKSKDVMSIAISFNQAD